VTLRSRPGRNAPNPILSVNCLTKQAGAFPLVDNLSFEVDRSEILGVIGPNGAGKTTLFDLITGNIAPDGGRIVFDGRDVTRDSISTRCRLGIGRTYQIPRPFQKMTVYENLLVAAVHGARRKGKGARALAEETLDFVGLRSLRDHVAGGLSFMDTKLLEMGRALATDPSLLLIDEVTSGLAEYEAESIFSLVREIRGRGVTVVWIEHVPGMLSETADRLLVLAEGKLVLSGEPKDVINAPEVVHVYWGREESACLTPMRVPEGNRS